MQQRRICSSSMRDPMALQIFWCTLRFALSGTPYVMRRLHRASFFHKRVKLQRLENSPRALHFPTRVAVARFCRHRSISPPPPPEFAAAP
jgi:hypothetical protein